MTELILSEITRMKPGVCIIGIKPAEKGYRSVRPGPPYGHAWPLRFPHHRGDKLQFELSEAGRIPPHIEDHWSTGVRGQTGRVSEAELLACLQKAEVAGSVRELFGYKVCSKRRGAYVLAKFARRSICGVEAPRIRLSWEAKEIRASVVLPSDETLPDLPVVDHSWHSFAEAALEQMDGANKIQRLNRFLTQRFQRGILKGEKHFLRIGLTRPTPNVCWLMVDTLFPFPRKSWLAELCGGPGATNPPAQ